MSNILIISAVFPPEPLVSAKLSFDIAEVLSKSDKVTVLCPNPSRPKGFDHNQSTQNVSDKYTINHVDSYTCAESKLIGRIRESYSFGRQCAKFIKANKANLQTIYINSWPFISQYLIIKQATKSDIKTVLHIQDIYPESLIKKIPKIMGNFLFKILLPIDIFTLKKATKIIGISNRMNLYLSASRKINIEKFYLVRNWQEDAFFLNFKASANINKEFVFMYTGSISASAGVEVLIKSFVKANLDKTKLIIAGDGAEKEKCVSIAKEIGNNSTIEFCNLTPSETPLLQSKATVLLLPLKKGIALTATPSKLTAYLLSGKPVLASVELNTDVSEIINEGKCGIVKEPENIDAIAKGMKEMYFMKTNTLEEMGANSKKYAENYLSKKVNLKKCVSIIKNI